MNRYLAATLAALTLAATLAVPSSGAPSAAPVSTIARTQPLHVITAAKPALSWGKFIAHVRQFNSRASRYLDQIADAVDYSEDTENRKLLGGLSRLIKAEQTWLAKYRPLSCYKPLYDREVRMLGAFKAAIDDWYRWMRTGNLYYGERGNDRMDGVAAQQAKINKPRLNDRLLTRTLPRRRRPRSGPTLLGRRNARLRRPTGGDRPHHSIP